MPRFLIAAAIVVGVLTLSAVGFMIHKSRSGHQPTVVAPADEPAVANVPAKPAARAVRPRTPQTAPVAAPTEPAEAADSAVKPTTTAFWSNDVTAFLDNLTPEEYKTLQAAMSARDKQKRTQDRRYQLSVRGQFNYLDRVDPKLALSEAQRAQLNSTMDGLKPKMDATFKDTWAQQDQLRSQMDQIYATTTDRGQARQQTEGLRQQLDALDAAMKPQQDAFNQQVMSAMTPYLTPEQAQALKTMPANVERRGGNLSANGRGAGGANRRGRGGN